MQHRVIDRRNRGSFRPPVAIGLAALALAGLSLVACDDDDDAASEVAALTAATPGGIGFLTEAHEGWGQSACLTCHPEPHLDGFPIGACAHCHGANGAPFNPEGHPDDGCTGAGCHENVHAALDVRSPNDCRACHTYASTAPCTHTEDYDVVVIGAGGGGLSAGTKLAQEGENVLIVEQQYKPGGCMVSFDRRDYTFEGSLHAIDGPVANTLATFGIEDEIKLVASDIMYRAVFPDFTMDVPAAIEDYRAALKAQFPDQAAGIDILIDAISNMDIGAFEGMTVTEALNSIGINDEKLIALITELSGFLAGGPDYLPATLFVAMLWGYHVGGYYYLEGGSQSISDALAAACEEAGGTLKLNSLATKIVIENGRATRVETANGGCYNARYVISNANLPDTYLKLVGEANLPAEVVDEVKTKEPAPSFATLYLGVDHDYTDLFPSGTHEIFVGTGYDTDFGGNVQKCDPAGGGFGISNYTALDPLSAPPGKNAIAISMLLDWDCNDEWQWNKSYADYNAYKADIAALYVERAEAYLPDLSAHVEVMEMATARTVAAYTLNPKGSWAGFGIGPDSTGLEFMNPDDHKTPIANLFITGAWVGVAGQSVALNSGLQAADLVLKAE